VPKRFQLWSKAPFRMRDNSPMRLDHVSYVTSHEQLADTVQRLGSRLGSTFVDGGIHPRFGTRNFTCALKNGQYIEVVCPLDHPAAEQTPWGRAVSRKAEDGGGWFTWVFSTDDISVVEERFGRSSTEGHRTKPNGSELKWRQVGVMEISDNRQLPFFIQWLSEDHPSQDGTPAAQITKICIADDNQLERSWFRKEILASLGEIEIDWVNPSQQENQSGIIFVELSVGGQVINLD
jgi:hypothetical protein